MTDERKPEIVGWLPWFLHLWSNGWAAAYRPFLAKAFWKSQNWAELSWVMEEPSWLFTHQLRHVHIGWGFSSIFSLERKDFSCSSCLHRLEGGRSVIPPPVKYFLFHCSVKTILQKMQINSNMAPVCITNRHSFMPKSASANRMEENAVYSFPGELSPVICA